MSSRDRYGRRPTSTSRGKTHERIMRMGTTRGTIPGAEQALAEAPPGSIAACILAFHDAFVAGQGPTSRRAYERTLALFANDLLMVGPAPTTTATVLTRDRLVAHLDWRVAHGLHDAGELQRGALHLSRLSEWIDTKLGCDIGADRAWMRTAARDRIAMLPPAFQTARSADELRDTSRDEAMLDWREPEGARAQASSPGLTTSM